MGLRERQQADKGEAHADHEGEGLRPAVREYPDQRLQQRCAHLEGERQQADLAEVEAVIVLQDWVDRRKQRLDQVVQQVRYADGSQDGHRDPLRRNLEGCSRHDR
jgi:hypothetical protein